MAHVPHLCQWLPHLNLLIVLRSWQSAMLLRFFKDVVTLKRVYVTILDPLCLHMSDSCFVFTHSFLPSFITPFSP
jgi:hypothetical protein